ncbi:MAG TPA: rod shape-determining protein RodA [Acidimicrobiia bacterium]|nr:rod shape-determining protein RodA [Acidimicrobiia bacterium]
MPRPSIAPAMSSRRARFEASPARNVDLPLIGSVVAIGLVGLLMIYSSTRERLAFEGIDEAYFVKRQAIFILLGLCVMAAVMAIDYRKLRDFSVLAYGAVVISLLAVLSPLGSDARGAQAWFELPGGFQLQPSELAKFGIIVAVAGYCNEHRGEMHPRQLALTIGLAAVPVGLVALQPDLGTGMVIALIVVGLLALSGVSGRNLAILGLLALTGIWLVINLGMLKDYQVDRLTSVTNSEADPQGAGYNQEQSELAMKSGAIDGQGLYQGPQTQGGFVPEQHTDFIFTAAGEELGFIGAGSILALFAIVVWRVWRTATLARDFYGMLVCMGVLAMLAFQIFENIGMTMGIMPVTGIPLPFMSYGGSATITAFACIGLVSNVYMRRFVG